MESPSARLNQDELYQDAIDSYGPGLNRLARGYEADADKRRDLLQNIHLQLWLSFKYFNGHCSMRTWVYRVAHNCGRSHVTRESRTNSRLVDLGQLESAIDNQESPQNTVERKDTLERLSMLIRQMKTTDRQVILLYLEGLDGASISEITGLSPANVAVRIGRIKRILTRRFTEGMTNAN